ncbi:hypothetical protein GUITHDRAFT_144940 [Guillardia theta CCMP2712]|uniref:PLAT domain-containing protein n=1 Tax=Guillardia theta (strain CCMP2712) TaxID=905079 RepID=L1IMM2_GUITC|nr:hypothetical protein GUITHDRAFT_144940 [Guillardia theta CCMP2712]EKX37506.1 hypothetical protein GUITHDRAFT_144940 [Guillardia theta CCMP2712]|eukprot:XP_005824486.1 hypothetical protein GUITHDRAFT_144940 [Guillardia theta CCMP2712]
MAGNREERPGGRLRARTRQSDRMAGEEEEDPVLRAGRFSSRAGVLGRDTEDGVSSLLDLRRQADEVSRRAGGMRKSVVDAKVAMVAQRLAFERRLQVGEQDGADPVTKARSSHAWAEIPTDHLKFGKLVKGRNEVDEEVLALRREIVEGEREYRSLIVQKSKLDRMAAAFTSSRVIQELSSKELSYNMTDDMKKLLKSTNRLRSQISMQGEAAPGLKVPHLSSYGSPTAAGPRGSSNSSAVNRQNNERLELSLLRDKVQTLESKISEFENNMSLASILDDSEVKRIVDDYLLEEHSISYQLEVRTGSHEKSQTDCEVYVSLAGTMGFSEREMLFNPHYGQTSFEKGSVRYFIIRTSKDLGELQNMTVWIGSVGDKPSWFLEDIIVYNLKTVSDVFVCGGQLWGLGRRVGGR